MTHLRSVFRGVQDEILLVLGHANSKHIRRVILVLVDENILGYLWMRLYPLDIDDIDIH
jgi:hypothetical protein